MPVTLIRVINPKGPFFPQSFLPASLPDTWEQSVSFQFMSICSCQKVTVQPLATGLDVVSFCSAPPWACYVLLWLLPQAREDTSSRLVGFRGAPAHSPGLGSTLSAS